MALISLRQLLDHAAENGYGVPAFNINNMEQVLAIMEVAHGFGRPVAVLFQPHRFSRTARFAREFADALASAISVVGPGRAEALLQRFDGAGAMALSLEIDGLAQLLSTDYKFAVSFAILVIVLLFRPTGLFKGKAV